MVRRLIQIGLVGVIVIAFVATAASVWRGIHIQIGSTYFESEAGLFVVVTHQPSRWKVYEVGNDLSLKQLFAEPWFGTWAYHGHAMFLPWWMIDSVLMIIVGAIFWKMRRRKDRGFPISPVTIENPLQQGQERQNG